MPRPRRAWLAVAGVAAACGRTPLREPAAARRCVAADDDGPAGAPLAPPVAGPCGPYVALATGRPEITQVADRCDGTVLVALADRDTRAPRTLVLGPARTVL